MRQSSALRFVVYLFDYRNPTLTHLHDGRRSPNAHKNTAKKVSCDELSDADSQNFAVIANGEFIKTNAIPTTQDPSDWLNLINQASDNFLTWEFAAFLVLGVIACSAVACACRRFNRSLRHRLKVSKYRREITANRGGARGCKVHSRAGPVRHPGELNVTGPGRFRESWRRPGAESIGGRSSRSMRSEQSARGALLTGAGALVPGHLSEEPDETCPACGLRLPDVVQMGKHVETQHGGRVTRKRDRAAAEEVGQMPRSTAGLKVVEAEVMKTPGSKGASVVKIAPWGDLPPRTGIPDAAASTAAGADVEVRPLSLPPLSPLSGSRGLRQYLPQLLLYKPDGGGAGSGKDPRDSSPAAACDMVTNEAVPSSLPARVTTSTDSGSGGGGSDSDSDSTPQGEPRELSAGLGKLSAERHGGESGRRQRCELEREETTPVPELPTRSIVKEESERSLTRTSSLDRMSALSSRAITRSTRQMAEEENAAGNGVGSTAGDGGSGARGAGGAANETARAELISRRRIRRSASTEDVVPPAHRLTAVRLRALGSGLPENLKLPPSVFSPVKASAKEPAYSPVDRERAGELDKERPVSMTRKFFRQLSREA